MKFVIDSSEIDFSHPNIVLYFYAPWMPYHKKMVCMLEKLEIKYNDLYFYAINVDLTKDLITRFNIGSIPEILLFKLNKLQKNVNGICLTKALNSIFSVIYDN